MKNMKIKSCNFKIFNYRANLYVLKEHIHLWIGPSIVKGFYCQWKMCIYFSMIPPVTQVNSQPLSYEYKMNGLLRSILKNLQDVNVLP